MKRFFGFIILCSLLPLVSGSLSAQTYSPRIITDIFGHVGIGTTVPDRSALLDLSATNAGLLWPRMNTVQRDAILSPATSLLIYHSSLEQFEYFDGIMWVPFLTGNNINGSAWTLLGNSGTNPALNFLGTTDNQPLAIRTNNAERLRVSENGNVGIGTGSPSPSALLDLSSNTGGILIPRMTTIDRDLIVGPATGLLIFNTDANEFQFFDGTIWQNFASVSGWALTGNGGTDPVVNYLGTTDNQPIVFRTNAVERARIDETGNIRFFNALMPNNNAGIAGQVLTSGGAGVVPSWSSTPNIALPFSNITTGINTGQTLTVGAGTTLGPTGTGIVRANSLIGAGSGNYAGSISIPANADFLDVSFPGLTANAVVVATITDDNGVGVIVAGTTKTAGVGFRVYFSAQYPTATGAVDYVVINP